uniref:Uncharacterized protein n=1 Tax=Panagrellus redivivus TaxID=6233 RepID=A0A7E4VUL1_PANRE
MFSLALSAFFLNSILPLALIVMPMAFCSKKKQSQKATSTHHHRRKGDQDPGQIDHRRDTRRSKSPALPPKFDEVNFGSERGQNISIAVTHVHTNRKSRRQKKAVKSADPQPPTTSVGTSEDPYKRPPSSSSAEDEEGDEDPNSVQPVAPSSRTGGQQQQQQQTPQAGTPNPSHSRTSTKLKSAEMDQWMADIRADRERQKRN